MDAITLLFGAVLPLVGIISSLAFARFADEENRHHAFVVLAFAGGILFWWAADAALTSIATGNELTTEARNAIETEVFGTATANAPTPLPTSTPDVVGTRIFATAYANTELTVIAATVEAIVTAEAGTP